MTTDNKAPCGIQEIIPDEKYISQGKNPRRYYREEQYNKLQSHADKLQLRLEKCEAFIRWIKEQKEYFEAKPHKMLGDIYNHQYFTEVEGE